MFIHCNIQRMKCIRFSDPGATAEYYFTWRAYLGGEKDTEIAQGFSLGCPIDDGYSMAEGDTRLSMNDPRFTLALPNVQKGETKRFVLDLFCWEADSSSEETKRLFTNDAAKKLMQVYKASEARSKKTKDELTKWVKDGNNPVLNALAAAGVSAPSAVAPYEVITTAAFKILDGVLAIIRSNSDDYLGMSRSEVIYTRDADGKLLYRWVFNNGFETWFPQEQPVIHQSWRVDEANRDNELDCKLIVQIASESPTEFQ
jgi:hypothetical protein